MSREISKEDLVTTIQTLIKIFIKEDSNVIDLDLEVNGKKVTIAAELINCERTKDE